jgi:hypothetical protein
MSSKPFSISNYRDILYLHEEEYRASKGTKHQAVLQKIMDQITSDEGYKFKGTEKELQEVRLESHQWVLLASPIWLQKIKNWYNNHKSAQAEEPAIVLSGSWNYRRVVQHEYKEEIAKKMEATGLRSTDPGWIKKYQEAVTQIIDSLGGEDVVKEHYKDVARSWNGASLPEELRRK